MENGTWDATLKCQLDGFNEALELNTTAWNCPIDQCFFVNSKWAPRKIEKLLQNITTDGQFDEYDLLYRSYLMREIILNHICEVPEITLDAYLVPLPMILETERMSALRVIESRIQELLKTVDIENKLSASHLREIDRLHTEIADIKNSIEWFENEIRKMSAIQKTPSLCIHGDDWFRLFPKGDYSINAPCDNNSPCGGCECRLEKQQHNASDSKELPTNGNTYWIHIKPDMLNFRKKEDHYWFCRFWLEYSGEKHNAKKIQEHLRVQDKYKAKQRRYTLELQRKMKELDGCEKELIAHSSNLESLTSYKGVLRPKLFNIEDIHGVLASMQKFMNPEEETSNSQQIISETDSMSKTQRNTYRPPKEVEDESDLSTSEDKYNN
jgi:hypothetical protein